VTPRITRNFNFDRDNGQWVINNRFADCNQLRFTVTQNSAENWVLTNPRNDWQHPIHVHLEEHQILQRSSSGRHDRSEYQYSGGYSGDGWGSGSYGGGSGSNGGTNGNGVPTVEIARKDVTRLQFNESDTLFSRFRDFVGDWPMHCHNTVHEDHAMMLLFQVQPNVIDNNQNP